MKGDPNTFEELRTMIKLLKVFRISSMVDIFVTSASPGIDILEPLDLILERRDV